MTCSIPQACQETANGTGEFYATGDANSATFEEEGDSFLYIVYKSNSSGGIER